MPFEICCIYLIYMSKRENDLVIELSKIVCKKGDFNFINFFGFLKMQKNNPRQSDSKVAK